MFIYGLLCDNAPEGNNKWNLTSDLHSAAEGGGNAPVTLVAVRKKRTTRRRRSSSDIRGWDVLQLYCSRLVTALKTGSILNLPGCVLLSLSN